MQLTTPPARTLAARSNQVIPGHGSTTTIEFERKFNFALPALPEGGDGGDGGGSSSAPGAGGNVHPYFSSASAGPVFGGCCCSHPSSLSPHL